MDLKVIFGGSSSTDEDAKKWHSLFNYIEKLKGEREGIELKISDIKNKISDIDKKIEENSSEE